MKIERKALLNLSEPLSGRIDLCEGLQNNAYLRKVSAEGEFKIYYDAMDELKADLNLKGEMICPCAITLEDVKVPFTFEETVGLSFEDDKDTYFIKDDLDLDEMVMAYIVPLAPIKVVKNGKIEYPRGDGWQVMSEEAYEKPKADKIDPRWDKLKEYQFDKEE